MNLLLVWTMKTHDFHEIIKNNWTRAMKLENIVLSSATLPTIEEMKETINNYKTTFWWRYIFYKKL